MCQGSSNQQPYQQSQGWGEKSGSGPMKQAPRPRGPMTIPPSNTMQSSASKTSLIPLLAHPAPIATSTMKSAKDQRGNPFALQGQRTRTNTNTAQGHYQSVLKRDMRSYKSKPGQFAGKGIGLLLLEETELRTNINKIMDTMPPDQMYHCIICNYALARKGDKKNPPLPLQKIDLTPQGRRANYDYIICSSECCLTFQYGKTFSAKQAHEIWTWANRHRNAAVGMQDNSTQRSALDEVYSASASGNPNFTYVGSKARIPLPRDPPTTSQGGQIGKRLPRPPQQAYRGQEHARY